VLLCNVAAKYLRSRTCLLLLLLLCIRIVIPTGLSPIALVRIPNAKPSSTQTDTVPDVITPAPPVVQQKPDTALPPIDPPHTDADTPTVDENVEVVPPIASEDAEDAEAQAPWGAWEIVNCAAPIVWIIGAVVCFSTFYVPGAIYRRRLRKSCSPVTDDTLLQIYRTVCADVGVRGIPTLYQSNAVHSPCLCGIFHPYIVLPCDGAFTTREIEMLLHHEVQHDRSGDLYIKHLINLLLFVQWWNPTFYLLARQASYYIEASCDESVLKGRDAEFRLQYGALLAKIAKKSTAELKMHYALEAGFARKAGHTALRRVQNLLENTPRHHGRMTVMIVALLCVLSLFLYGFVPPEGVASAAPEEEPESETVTGEVVSDEPSETTVDDQGETTVPQKPEPQPTETSALTFSRIPGYNWYEVSGVRDRTATDLTVPATHQGVAVVRIADGAFADCDRLVRVVVADSVKDIGNSAFARCVSLREVTLSRNLVSLGSAAFYGCVSLAQIEIPGGVMALRSDTFSQCTSLCSVTLAEGIERIESRAFEGNTSLTQLTLPASVWMLEASAIKDCGQLRTLQYRGTVRRWEGVMRQTSWDGDVMLSWCDGGGFSSVECSDGISVEIY